MHAYETPVIYTDVSVSTFQIDFNVLKDDALKQLKKFHVTIDPSRVKPH